MRGKKMDAALSIYPRLIFLPAIFLLKRIRECFLAMQKD